MLAENPFHKTYDSTIDLVLIEMILAGDKSSLEKLIKRNQCYIFNVALKMFNSIADAEDATQEVLIKVIANLSRYDKNKSQFRTWLYRITINHFLDFKKTNYETLITNFGDFFNAIEAAPAIDLSEEEAISMKLLIEESKVSCMAGMLLCLNREQRLIYILGEIFEIEHIAAAEIFDITPVNFRKKLSRARSDLYQWMNNKCGLVNRANTCRCPKKTKSFIANGWVDPEKMKWHAGYKKKIYALSHERIDDVVAAWEDVYASLYRDHPFKTFDTSAMLLEKILGNKIIRDNLNLS